MLTIRRSFAAISALLQLIILFSYWGHTSFAQLHLSQKISSETATAFEFLDSLLQPKLGCKGKEYIITDFGEGGGFASQFQMAATHWLRVTSGHNYTIPVLIRGHIRGYTSGKECQHVMNDYTCVFLPMSACQHELLSTGILVNEHKHTKEIIDSSMVPSQFAHKGLAWWWGIIQARMFRLQPVVENYIKDELEHMKRMNSGRGFPFGSPIAGLHVRHGDKSIDGFIDHSFEAELKAIRKSPECILGPENYCFTNSIPMESDISTVRNGSSFSTEQDRNASSINHEAGDGNSNDNDVDGKTLELATKSRYSSAKMVIYVASDDDKVLVSAKKLGHLVDSSGFSQKTSEAGMVATLKNSPEMGYNASLEIITDIYFLSHCSTLVGIAASQIFRTAVGISNATGVLQAAIVMDYDQLPKIQRLSSKYRLPLPEHFIDSRDDTN